VTSRGSSHGNRKLRGRVCTWHFGTAAHGPLRDRATTDSTRGLSPVRRCTRQLPWPAPCEHLVGYVNTALQPTPPPRPPPPCQWLTIWFLCFTHSTCRHSLLWFRYVFLLSFIQQKHIFFRLCVEFMETSIQVVLTESLISETARSAALIWNDSESVPTISVSCLFRHYPSSQILNKITTFQRLALSSSSGDKKGKGPVMEISSV
jgi:hypothetical protein